MKVALYDDHHNLPFWHSPKNPQLLFNPEKHGTYNFENSMSVGRKRDSSGLATQHYMWPILLGLHELNLPEIMAHVSFIIDESKQRVGAFNKRKWVQITTEPVKFERSLPIIVEGNQVVVESLWGRDNGTASPLEFTGSDTFVDGEETAIFWENLFHNKLRESKKEAQIEFQKCNHTLELYSNV